MKELLNPRIGGGLYSLYIQADSLPNLDTNFQENQNKNTELSQTVVGAMFLKPEATASAHPGLLLQPESLETREEKGPSLACQ